MVDFTVRRDGTVEDAVYDVDPLSDTANPFGDFCVVKIDDRGGSKFDKYSRGTALEVSIDAAEVGELSIATGETITTSAGTTDAYRTVSNAGTYRNQGTVTSQAGEIDRFDGYVVEARETEQSGADALEVEAYTFDQFLRRNTVSNDQTGNTIAEALESIVKNDTPVSYAASNIEVSDSQELTRSYRGEPVEVVLRDLAFKSGNEAFGVNDSREFFFRPRETKHIDRGIDNTQWFNYDIPELGKDAINEVEVFFNDGNESVVIDAPTDKLELQDGLSLPEPGTQREELNRPLVTDIQDAEDIGRQYLQFRNATLSGTVTTFGLYNAEPGDTINITIESRGIDTEFRIAAVEYRWGRDETVLTVVERRGDQDKILSRISESVKRQEMETADRDAPSNRITTTEANAIVDVGVDETEQDSGSISNTTETVFNGEYVGDCTIEATVSLDTNESASAQVRIINNGEIISIDGNSLQTGSSVGEFTVKTSVSDSTFDTIKVDHDGDSFALWSYDLTLTVDQAQRFVNLGRNAVRDAWAGNGNPDISTIAIGTDGSGLSRSNTDLNNQVTSASATESLPTSTSAEYSASINQTGVEEIGLTTSGGTLIARAVFDTPVDFAGTVTVTLDVSNDSDVQRGVLTNDGQTAVRDVLADNAPNLPTDYAYGSDGSAVSTSDTALGNQLKQVSLSEVLVQDADTTTEWGDITNIGSTEPFFIDNGLLKVAQTTFVQEVEDTSGSQRLSRPDFSGGEGGRFFDLSSQAKITIDLDYETSNLRAYARGIEDSEFAIIEVRDSGGNRVGELGSFSQSNIEWKSDNLSGTYGPGTHTFEFSLADPGINASVGDCDIDIIAIGDDRFGRTLDNSVDANGFLSGPELFPSGVQESLNLATSRRNISEGTFNSTWKDNDVSGAQAIEIAPDGSTFQTFTNATSGSYSFTDPTQEITTRFTFDRYGSRTTATPTEGFKGQAVDLWELFVNPDTPSPDDIGTTNARAIVPPNTSGITGNTVREAGLKSGSTLLTHHQLAEFVLETDQRLASSETNRFKGTE